MKPYVYDRGHIMWRLYFCLPYSKLGSFPFLIINRDAWYDQCKWITAMHHCAERVSRFVRITRYYGTHNPRKAHYLTYMLLLLCVFLFNNMCKIIGKDGQNQYWNIKPHNIVNRSKCILYDTHWSYSPIIRKDGGKKHVAYDNHTRHRYILE